MYVRNLPMGFETATALRSIATLPRSKPPYGIWNKELSELVDEESEFETSLWDLKHWRY